MEGKLVHANHCVERNTSIIVLLFSERPYILSTYEKANWEYDTGQCHEEKPSLLITAFLGIWSPLGPGCSC